MGKIAKATRKFNAKHLKGALQIRKNKQVAKKREAVKNARIMDQAARAEEKENREKETAQAIDKMNMEDFLSGGFNDLDGLIGADLPEAQSDSEDEGGSEPDLSGDEDDSDQDGDDYTQAELEAMMEGESEEEEEEDESEDEEEDEKPSKGKPKGESSRHKAELDALKEKDPDFYKYLMESDKNLLEFSGSEDEDEEEEGGDMEASEDEISEGEEEEGSEEEEEDGQPEEKVSKSRRKVLELTSAAVQNWTKAALEQQSLNALTHLCKAFRVATHYGDSADRDDGAQFSVASSSAFNKLMITMLSKGDQIFRAFLSLGNKAKIPVQELKSKPKWRKVEPLLKSYLGNAVHTLTQVTDPGLLEYVLKRLRPSASFFAPFGKVTRRLLKTVLGVFGSGSDKPRVQALLLLREVSLVLPAPAHENVLKGAVRAFLSNAKFHTASNQGQLDFMAQSIVELASINATTSYAVGFSFVRQLAITMRHALTSKTREAYKEVYCWQYVHGLELWTRVVVNLPHSPDLRQLIYPLAQLLQGTARLVPTPRYFPLRLRCARLMNQLSAATNTYIPVAAVLLEILQFSGLKQAPKGAAAASSGNSKGTMDFTLTLRVPKVALRTTAFQDELVSQFFELMSDHLTQYAYHVTFPELSYLPLLRLRAFGKTSPVERFRRQATMLVQATERNVVFVGQRRDKAEFSPKDLTQIEAWLAEERKKNQAPLFQYNQGVQAKAKARQAAMRTAEVQMKEEEDVEGSDSDLDQDGSDDDEMLGGVDAALEDDDEEDEEDDDEDEPRQAGKKQKSGSGAPKAMGSLRADIDDDLVEDLELSEDEEEEEAPAARPAKQQKAHHGKGGDRKGGQRGGHKGGDRDRKQQHGGHRGGGKPQQRKGGDRGGQQGGQKRKAGGPAGGGGKKFKKH